MRTNFLRQTWTSPIHVFVDCISFTSHDQRSIKATLATLSQFEIVLLQVMSWWTSALVVQWRRKYCHHGHWSTHSSTPLTSWRNQPGCNWEKKETKTNQSTGLYDPCFAIWISLLFFILIPPVQKSGSGIETIILLSLWVAVSSSLTQPVFLIDHYPVRRFTICKTSRNAIQDICATLPPTSISARASTIKHKNEFMCMLARMKQLKSAFCQLVNCEQVPIPTFYKA